MASVYQHSRGKSPYWIAVFSDENRVQRHRSTKLRNKEKAQAMAERWQRAADELRKAKEKRGELAIPGSELILEVLIRAAQGAMLGRFAPNDARKSLDALLQATGKAKALSGTVREFLSQWLESKEHSVEPGTFRSYQEKISSFLDFLEKSGVKEIDAVTVPEVEAFRKEQVRLQISPTTINLKMKMIGTAFRYAKTLGYLSVNPFEALKPMPARNAAKEAFSLAQLKALLRAADEDWKGMVLIGACTGLRIGDAARLKWKNVDLENGTIVLFPDKTRRKALSKPHQAVILPDLDNYLRRRKRSQRKIEPETPIFPRLAAASVSGKSGLSLTFRALMDKTGIKCEVLREREKGGRGRRVYSLGFHSLRHSCTSLMANIGVREEIRKKLVGHTSDVHHRYTHHDLETIKKELKRFPSLVDRKQTPRPNRQGTCEG